MSKLKITAKGQVTLRKEVLEHLGVSPGAQIEVTKLAGGRIEVRAAPRGEISDFFSLLKREGGPCLSIDEMNEIAREGWAKASSERAGGRTAKTRSAGKR